MSFYHLCRTEESPWATLRGTQGADGIDIIGVMKVEKSENLTLTLFGLGEKAGWILQVPGSTAHQSELPTCN